MSILFEKTFFTELCQKSILILVSETKDILSNNNDFNFSHEDWFSLEFNFF